MLVLSDLRLVIFKAELRIAWLGSKYGYIVVINEDIWW